MSALTDLLHTIVNKLDFHTEAEVADAHKLVEDVKADVEAMVKDAVGTTETAQVPGSAITPEAPEAPSADTQPDTASTDPQPEA